MPTYIFLVPEAPSLPPVVNRETVTSNSATLSWVGLANRDITNYTVNLVATSSDAGNSRRKRQVMAGVVRECVIRNGRDVESNITVGPDQTSVQVNDLGKVLQLYIMHNQYRGAKSIVFQEWEVTKY